jgi:hypothetical protein
VEWRAHKIDLNRRPETALRCPYATMTNVLRPAGTRCAALENAAPERGHAVAQRPETVQARSLSPGLGGEFRPEYPVCRNCVVRNDHAGRPSSATAIEGSTQKLAAQHGLNAKARRRLPFPTELVHAG